jgi:Glyoxalase-like domain
MSQNMTRRDALRLWAAAGASCIVGSRMTGAQTLIPASKALDHLLLGVPDLDRGIGWVEQRTGVKAMIGGSHPGRGTRNALLSLGGRQYLEIIAPDPAQTTYGFQIDLRKLREPRLVNWAAAASDLDGLAKRASDAGQRVAGPRDGSRVTPAGATLNWRSLAILNDLASDEVDPIPFFIEWAAGTSHPSQTSPKGCELQSFAIEHPKPEAILSVLKAVGIDATVTTGPSPGLKATIRTPNGTLKLT